MKKKAFTLIELLVVIAIIAILASILFPLFLTAKAKAKTTKCMSHGKQVGQATVMYMNDYNDHFPSSLAWSPEAKTRLKKITWKYDWEGYYKPPAIWNAAQMGGWRWYQLKNYVKNDDIWICPDPNTMYAKRYAYGFGMSWLARARDNFVNGDRGFHNSEGVGRTIAEVMDLDRRGETICGSRYMPPTKKIMWMCYALGRWANNSVGNPPGVWPWIYPSYAHQDGSVFVYADGHAAWKRMGMGWSPLNYTICAIDRHQ